jgi:hypothetical protein
MSRVDGPQLPNREVEDPQRKGVRMPVVLATVVGIAGIAFYMQGQDFSSTDPGASFAEACGGIETGMPVLEARQQLMASAQGEGMKGPPDIQSDGRQMTFSFRPGGGPDAPKRTCTLVYAGDGQSVASARFSQGG